MQEENGSLDKFKFDIANLNIKLEKELIDTLNCFMNELELVFEYVNNIDDLRKYIRVLTENKEELQKFIKDCLDILKDNEEKIYNVISSKKK